MNAIHSEMGLKFASALLLHHGEISIEDIKAMPFFSDASESEAVIDSLKRTFNVEVYLKRISSEPIPEWEEVIKIKR